jgi:hypothetical protein
VGAERLARRAGFELVKRHFYSPLPDLELLEEVWERPAPMLGVDLGMERARRLMEEELAPYLAEFRPPLERANGDGFQLRNGSYENVDAETLYALLRHLKPTRVMELGSGNSSLVIGIASRRNASEGAPFQHKVFDPYPSELLARIEDVTVTAAGVADIDPAEYSELVAGDVLFVDTTHTVKTGGDVPHIVLDVLPRLAPGVYVHFHDIFLPYEYPREWVVAKRRAWAEQYMLQAFLAFNTEFEVVLPLHALARAHLDVVRRHVPSWGGGGTGPGAFWIRRLPETRPA